MSRGRRYEERKLNMKKVFAVILAIVVIIMSVFIIRGVFQKESSRGEITSKTYFAAYNTNKWGVIDENGDVIIEPSYEEMMIIPGASHTDLYGNMEIIPWDKMESFFNIIDQGMAVYDGVVLGMRVMRNFRRIFSRSRR